MAGALAETGAGRGVSPRLTQLLSLAAFLVAGWLVAKLSPHAGGTAVQIEALGLLLLTGTLFSEVCEVVRLPHLTGYLLAGVVAGPHALGMLEHETVKQLHAVNTLGLALIALAGGLELRIGDLRASARSLGWSMLVQCVVVFVVCSGSFVLLGGKIPFLAALGLHQVAAVALLWGVLAVSRSPSASLAILSQTKAVGPVSRFTLAFVMSSDVVVLVLLAVAMPIARLLLEPGVGLSLSDFGLLGHELLGSVSLGVTLGLLLIAYLRLVGGSLLVLLLVIGYGISSSLQYLRFDPLLTFLITGFVVRNYSSQGDRLMDGIHGISALVFVVFFALAGAHLDVPLLARLWPLALALGAARAVATWGAQRISSHLADDGPAIRKWGWTGLVSQAGLTLGMSVIIERAFPSFGAGLHSLVIATVAVNEVVGPILFKTALDRSGESRAHA